MPESRKRAILGSATLDFASVGAGADAELTLAVPGARPGQIAMVSAPDLEAGLIATAFVSDNAEATVRVSNVTGSGIDPASQTFYVAVIA